MKSKRSRAIARADKAFSDFIRHRAGEFSVCITCGKHFHWKDLDAGHFMPRDRMATRWDEKNVQPQCRADNRFKGGKQFVFGKELDRIYGKGTANRLEKKSRELVKFSIDEINEITKKYKNAEQ